MFSRSTTIMGNPEAIDPGIAYVRDEVMPSLLTIEGCIGLSMLLDRDTGQCIVTTSWQSEEAMRSSDLHLRPMRERAGELLGGQPQVEEWEIAVMHRDHRSSEGSCCRVVWMRANHTDMQRGIDIYRMSLLPRIESMPGFCSASLMVNRELQRACATTTFDTRDAMEAARDEAWAIREEGVRDAGVDVLDVAEYELCLAHLRVPELV